MALPANGVIYVQNVPTSTSDPNHSTCSGNGCFGDVNVSGTLNGQLTIASMDDIDITGNLVYHLRRRAATTCSVSVADNDVAGHGRTPNTPPCRDDLTIDAAIMSLNHSFYVQNWTRVDGGAPVCGPASTA